MVYANYKKHIVVSGTTLTMDEELPIGTKVCVIQVDDTYLDTVAFAEQSGYSLENNLIINGAFDFFDYATYKDDPTSTNEYCCANRWRTRRANNRTCRVGRTSVNPPTSSYAFYFRRNSGDSYTDAFALQQQIESRHLYPYRGKKVTLSFKLYADSGWLTRWGTSTIKIATGTTTNESISIGGTASGEVVLINSSTISAPSSVETWEEYSFTSSVTIPMNAACMYVKFLFGVTGTAAADEVLRIGEIKLEPGEITTPWKARFIPVEQKLCERYYEVGDASFTGRSPVSTVTWRINHEFRTIKRTTPAIAFTSVTTSGVSSKAANNISTTNFEYQFVITTTGNAVARDSWAADAEL
jgi:hypothetical protein